MNGKRLLLSAMLVFALLLLGASRSSARPPPIRPCSPIVTGPDRMIWDATGINPGDDKYPAVAYNSQDDEYLVVYEWADSPGRDLVSIRVDVSGQAALSPNGVAVSDAYTDTRPALAYNPTNNTYLAVWERLGSSGDMDIYGAVLHASGTVSGTASAIATWIGDQRYPDVAYSAAQDRYLVVWEDHYTVWSNPPDVFAAVVDSAGQIDDLEAACESVTGLDYPDQQTRPAVAAHGTNGRWLVAWTDSRNSGTTGLDIYSQQMQLTSGITLTTWGTQVAVAAVDGPAGPPDVAWGPVGPPDGTYLVVWPENYDTLLGQRILVDGTPTGAVITASGYDSSKSEPAAAYDAGDGSWWVVWADNRDYG